MSYELTFNGLDFSSNAVPHEDGYWFELLGADFSLGSPVPVERVIESLLHDGSMIERERDDNRDQGFVVVVCAPKDDGVALAAGEQALALATGVPCEMAWRGPHSVAATTVFEVVTSRLTGVYGPDYDLELMRGRAVYGLSISALPFGRSETETVVEALTVGAGSEVVISDGTSAAGWSSPDGAVTVSSGRLSVPAPATYSSIAANDDGTFTQFYDVDVTLTVSAIDFTTTPYLSLEYETSVPAAGRSLTAAYADGLPLVEVADSYLTAPVKRATVYTLDSSATVLRWVFSVRISTAWSTPVAFSLLLDNVKRGPRSPKASVTGRESLRSLAVGGSARTQASLQVAHETAGLGDTIVYTAPGLGSGYSPDLSQFYVTGGSATNDAALISGVRRTTSATPVAFDVPAVSLPRGGYVLFARVRAATANHSRALDWTATTRVGGVDLGGGQLGTSGLVALDTTAWKIVPLGGMVLPPVDVPATSSSAVRVTVARNGSASPNGEVQIDQVWLFYCGDDAALTIVAAGAGTPAAGSVHNRVWLDSPTLARPVPALWLGTAADRSDAFHAGALVSAWGEHRFPADGVGLYVATSGAVDAAVSSRHFKRWHTAAVD